MNPWWILLFTFLLTVGFSNSQDCTTPEGEEGECIPVKNCSFIKKLFRQQSTITQEFTDRVKQYHCSSGTRTVCCPYDIRNHKNFKLIDGVCGELGGVDKIFNGQNASLFEFPWMALLGYSSTTKRGIQWNCGGTLINNRYILTAAHCVTKDLVRIRLGEHTISEPIDCETNEGVRTCANPVRDISIEETKVHENYIRMNTEILHDIALIRLAESVTFSDSIKPVCLPIDSTSKNMEFNSTLIITGWGVTETGQRSNVLLKAPVPYKDTEECSNSFEDKSRPSSSVRIGRTHLCAGGMNGVDSCVGDSGGPIQALSPLVPQYIQLGVVSFGPKICASPGKPGVYTKVSHYMNWILDNMRS